MVATLIACHNRYPLARRCLQALFNQKTPSHVHLSVYLLDDASPDQTGSRLKQEFPNIRLLHGPGSLFWCRSMRQAWQQAALDKPDFFLWLNEDTFLFPSSLFTMLETFRLAALEFPARPAIVVGACSSEKDGTLTYGAQRRTGFHPARLSPLGPSPLPQVADTFEGNLVLVPVEAFQRVGMLDDFQHAMGDTDYGYRARSKGCQILQAPGILAFCERDEPSLEPRGGGWRRLLAKASKKNLPPGDWFRFLLRHAGWPGAALWAWTYVKAFFR